MMRERIEFDVAAVDAECADCGSSIAKQQTYATRETPSSVARRAAAQSISAGASPLLTFKTADVLCKTCGLKAVELLP